RRTDRHRCHPKSESPTPPTFWKHSPFPAKLRPQLSATKGVSTLVEGDSDEALMLKVAGGDKSAFARLFDRHQQSICRFAHRFVGDRARAEELAQDIFIKLYRNAS